MPRRLLRDGILRSKRVNSLTFQAEVFYRRLMSVVDDFGRYEADPEILLSACYPLNRRGVCAADVAQMLTECNVTAPQLVLIYEVAGSEYLEIVGFNQQTRSAPKFPGPEKGVLVRRCVPIGTQLVQEDVIPKTFSEDVFPKTFSEDVFSKTKKLPAVESTVQEGAAKELTTSAGVDTASFPKRKKHPGESRAEYELWQREQEQNGRLAK